MLFESLEGMLQRPARSLLTILGTVLGIGSFVAILGITATAAGQIDSRFNVLAASQVSVSDATLPSSPSKDSAFPEDADKRIDALNGVVHAAVYWQTPLRNPKIATSVLGGSADGLSLYAADPQIFSAMHASMSAGVPFNDFHQQRKEHVAVLGRGAANRLGISHLEGEPAIFINNTAYTVIGIFARTDRLSELLSAVILPSTTALNAYGPPTDPRAQMLIETKLGAAGLIASQVAIVLRPDNPTLLKVVAPTDPRELRGQVSKDVGSLYLILAAISLIIAGVGIANTTLVSVLERSSEIGLRRALGALRRHIAYQFLLESAALGGLGGLIGGTCAVIVVIVTSVLKGWTAILPSWAVIIAPVFGAFIGLCAGLYPSLRAARTEPVEALRR